MSNHYKRIAVVGNLTETLLGFRTDFIKLLVSRGYQVFAFSTSYSDETRAQVRSLGAEPVDYKLAQLGLNPFGELMAIWQLYRDFKRLKIDISYCYFAKPSIYGTIAAALAGVPRRIAKLEGLGRVFSPNDAVYQNRLSRCKKRVLRFVMAQLFKLSLPLAHLVLFLNTDDERDVRNMGVRIKRSEMIGGIGVCLEQYHASEAPTDPMRFIFVGRLLNEKGIRHFLAAAERVKQQHPQVEFWILGEPDEHRYALTREELDDYVRRDIVHYPGRVNNVLAYLQQSSVFVLPSYYREGVPRSTQEALAVGRAVITTDMPGCRDTVLDGVNGLLVKPQDTESLVVAMQRLIAQPELVVAMGTASVEIARQRFDTNKINQRVEQLLQQEK